MDRLDFQAAIDWLAAKTNLDTNDWADGQGVTQLSAFTVASAKGSLLQDIRDTLDRSISEGEDVQGFLKRFTLLESRWTGANAWRGTLIYETNIRAAYGAGRLEQLNQVKATRPFWQWRHGNSPEPRPEHLKMDGKIFRADDVTTFPPSGFGCRCQVFSLSEREFLKTGKSLSKFTLKPDKGFAERKDVEKRIAELKLDKTLKNLISEEVDGS